MSDYEGMMTRREILSGLSECWRPQGPLSFCEESNPEWRGQVSALCGILGIGYGNPNDVKRDLLSAIHEFAILMNEEGNRT